MSIIKSKSTALLGQTAHPASLRYDRAHGIVELAVDNARKCLLRMQRDDGHWVAELQGDTILESEYVLLMTFLGTREGRQGPQGGPLHPQPGKAGGRLGLLSRRSGRRQRFRQGLLRPETDRARHPGPVHAPGAPGDSGAGGGRYPATVSPSSTWHFSASFLMKIAPPCRRR